MFSRTNYFLIIIIDLVREKILKHKLINGRGRRVDVVYDDIIRILY
jgi:hypothetical protein